MRIIRGKDYYDSAMSYGQDQFQVFVRTPESKTFTLEEIPDELGILIKGRGEKESWLRNASYRDDRGNKFWRKRVAVLFCGKLYVGVKAYLSRDDDEIKSDIFYSLETLTNWLDLNNFNIDYCDKNFINLSLDKKNNFHRYLNRFSQEDVPVGVKTWLQEHNISIITYVERNSFQITEDSININADNLKHLNFYKVVDAYTAYQELAMWIGEIYSRKENEIIKLSDEELIQKHGFDKWSFRKMPKKHI